MALAIILFAAAGCIAAFLYFKMLICVKEYAVPLKSECTQSIVGNSPLASTAKEAQSTETAKPKGGNEAPLQPERNLTTPGDKEGAVLGTAILETASTAKVPEVPGSTKPRTAVPETASTAHMPDLQAGFAASTAKLDMNATAQLPVQRGLENNANKAVTLGNGLNRSPLRPVEGSVIPDQATATALNHARRSKRRKRKSSRNRTSTKTSTRGEQHSANRSPVNAVLN